MLKRKPAKSLLLVCLLLAFYGCTTKNEVPQPVVDTQRVDALRAQLITLQQQVLGAQQETTSDSLSLTQLQAQIAALEADLQKSVSYTVKVASFLFKPLSGATVKLSQGGKIVSGTTASDGTTTFTGLYAGIITATVDLAGFARLVFRADIRSSYNASTYSALSQVLMLPLGGTAQADSAMTIQYWKLYANYSIVDDTLGGALCGCGVSTPSQALPAGPDPNNPSINYDAVTAQPVMAYLNENSFSDGSSYYYDSYAVPIGFTGWDVNISESGLPSGNGQVVSVAYENAKWVATANSSGIYTIKLPASDITAASYTLNSVNVFRFVIDFGEFTHAYTQYTDNTPAFIIKNTTTNPPPPTYQSTYIYRMGGAVGGTRWSSIQTTSLTSAWPFFYTGAIK
jgi:hypothetical protein